MSNNVGLSKHAEDGFVNSEYLCSMGFPFILYNDEFWD